MKKTFLLLLSLLFVATAFAQDKIYLKATGHVDCQIKTLNYAEGIILYNYNNLGQKQEQMIAISDVSGIYISKEDKYYTPDDNGEMQESYRALYAQPEQKNRLGLGVSLRAAPMLSAGLELTYSHFFNQKSGVGFSVLANPLKRDMEDFQVNAAQVYLFPHFTQHFYQYTSASALYYSLGFGVSYQGGHLYKKVVERDSVHGIHEEEYIYDDWDWSLGQFSLVFGWELYLGDSHRNMLDLSVRAISPEVINPSVPSTIREKLGYSKYLDGLYFSVGWRFGL